jgi:hypothetical protein
VIETRPCPHCGCAQLPSAAFCSACGFEFRAPRFGDEPPPPVPSWDRRARLQGKPAIRVVAAILAALAASLPLHLLARDATALLLLDALLAGVVLGCVALERGALAPALAASGGWLLALAVPAAYAVQALGWIWVRILKSALGEPPGGHPFAGMPLWVQWVSVVAVAGIFEELAFRGVFLRSAKIFLRPVAAHLLTAGAFAAIHFNPPLFPYHFLVGLTLGWLRERSGSLWPPILMHAAHNAAVLGLLPGAPLSP